MMGGYPPQNPYVMQEAQSKATTAKTFGIVSLVGVFLIPLLAIVFGILAINIGLLIANQNRPCIHDLMAVTVVIDHGSQQIFDTPEDLLEYKKKLAADDAERQEY